MSDVTFRLATEEDVESVLGLMRQYYEEDGYPFSESRARKAVLGLMADQSLGRLWVMETEGQIVGYLAITLGYSLEYLGRDAFVDEIVVAPDWRGRGLGTRALALAEETCRELGVNALHLEVEREKTAAQNLYRRAGFVDHDRYLMTRWL
jgi:ribosomal protein S18 acetylase RimI-like enzyme